CYGERKEMGWNCLIIKMPNTTTTKTTQRYLELDALRGIATLMVVLIHYTLRWSAYYTILKQSTTGVDLFFIISGFVIFMSLNYISGSREFIVNRLARLYPTYWAAVTFTFLLMVAVTVFYGQELNTGDIWRY